MYINQLTLNGKYFCQQLVSSEIHKTFKRIIDNDFFKNLPGVIFSMSVGAIYICNNMMKKQNKHLFDNITNLYIMLIDPYISGTLTVAAMLIRRKQILLLLNLLDNIDNKFKKIAITPSYKLITVMAWSVSIAIPTGMCIWGIHMYIIRKDNLDHLMWRMCFTPCYVMYNYFMTIYTGKLILIYQRFCLLNKKIISLHHNNTFDVSKLLLETKRLHYLLCDLSNKLAIVCDLPILLVTVKVYITTIACVLSFYGMVPHMHSELTVWMSVYWIYFLLSMVISELINKEVGKFLSPNNKN